MASGDVAKRKTMKCPECGVVLRPEQVEAHLSYHWGDQVPDPMYFAQAHDRYMTLYKFMTAAGVEEMSRPQRP